MVKDEAIKELNRIMSDYDTNYYYFYISLYHGKFFDDKPYANFQVTAELVFDDLIIAFEKWFELTIKFMELVKTYDCNADRCVIVIETLNRENEERVGELFTYTLRR